MRYKHILLIDDDEDDQEIFLSALQNVPAAVVCSTADNGHEALEKLTTKQIIPDLIFLDLNMPLMSGQEFLKEIKRIEELRQIPVIILSTSSNASTIREIKSLGALDFITKPDKYDQLQVILEAVLT